MALNIRSMRLVSTGSGRAMTEILISDDADEDRAIESLRIRVSIPFTEINIRTAEHAAMKRTQRICEDIEQCLGAAHVPSARPGADAPANGGTAGKFSGNRPPD